MKSRRTRPAHLYIMAYLLAVVVLGTVITPSLPELPPTKWLVTFALTCVAIGVVIGFGMREVFMPQEDENE